MADKDELEVIGPVSRGKGRPTPKRRDIEARNRRPLVPKDRKAAKKASKAERNRKWEREQYAMKTGDEANLPYNHRGRVRRWGRDYVDARRNFASLFMPLALVILLLMILVRIAPEVAFWGTAVMYLAFFGMLIDAVLMSRRAKKQAVKKFGVAEIPSGFRWMVATRAFYIRRLRRPIPMVQVGQWPDGAKD